MRKLLPHGEWFTSKAKRVNATENAGTSEGTGVMDLHPILWKTLYSIQYFTSALENGWFSMQMTLAKKCIFKEFIYSPYLPI